MEHLLIVLFWISISLILITYLVYPFMVIYMPKRKSFHPYYKITDRLPEVTIVFAAYNEESVIENKIRSLYQTTYPTDKIAVLVGSDNSSDRTDEILTRLMGEFASLQLVRFENRTGKSGIINTLVALCKSPLLIATDANIIFEEETIYQLVKHFKEESIHLVGGHILYRDKKIEGIALQEQMYLNLENRIKHAESQLWGLALGVEGGCYAIRKDSFHQIPPLTFMEDFYITMAVLSKGKKVWFEPHARCYEDVSTQLNEEFKRKVRISIGNWQNLNRFTGLLFKPFYPLGLAFFCHKVLRWITPFLALFAFGMALMLAKSGNIYEYLVWAIFAVLLLLPLDFLLMKKGLHTGLLRFINHFLLMNLALLAGFIKYSKGVKSNVWQPTKRNQ